MYYMIKEGIENNITSREITIKKFIYLTESDEFIIKKILTENQILKNIRFPEKIIDTAVDMIINNTNINKLYDLLVEKGVPLYSLIISPIKICKEKYEKLKEFKTCEKIIIVCHKDNIEEGLELAKKLGKKTIIDGTSISLKEYKNILSRYNIASLKELDIEINYQEQSNPISIEELYKTSLLVDEISSQIEKYNLSPLEQIIYAYDIVKNREYKECEEDKDKPRDLNKIIESNYTVCVGYSNLLIAVLNNLNIKAMPLISTKTKHQRSMVYIKDDKYKIDGVFVFDPTYDSRTNTEYINKYNYFAILPKDSEKDCPSDIANTLNITLEDLINLYIDEKEDTITRIATVMTKEYELKRAFSFIDEDTYEELVEQIRTQNIVSTNNNCIKHYYNRYIKKYNPKEISIEVLISAIYTVRKLEYYDNITNKLSLMEVVDAVKDRLLYQRLKYNPSCDKYEILCKTLNELGELAELLEEELKNKESEIKRNKLNMRLLKILRKSQK